MFTERQTDRVLGKLKRLEEMLEPLLFEKVDEMEMESFLTDGSWHSVPEASRFSSCPKGAVYEGEGIYVWLRGSYQVPQRLRGETLFLWPKVKAYEGMLWVDGKPYGNFASKFAANSHGNHYCDLITGNAETDKPIEIAIEYYAHHFVKGTQPLKDNEPEEFKIVYEGMDICVKREKLADFYYDLKIANQMAEALDKGSFRRAAVVRALLDIHAFLYYDFENVDWDVFMDGVQKADAVLKQMLSRPNAPSAPYAGFIGHSHMDTAWLWTRKETEKKCARTYANQMSLMDQYPDYTFIQSSAYHGDIIRRLYPDLFEEIKKRVKEGRYEPNGGVWIESDCNIPSGEYMIRQFVWGQRFTRKHFDYTSDAFWLPDTFGYSASLPQIMQGCGVKYFLTTKISWNDTNEFPYDTFYWKGIDGSKVLVHFNRSHAWPSPETMAENIMSRDGNTVKEKETSDMRLLSYGFGDGGGGPEFAMIEMADRLKDVEGLPRSSHTTVSGFMKRLEEGLYRPSTYVGELYLELHRGTLTNQHTIKRNNRKAEFALRDLEYMTVREAVLRDQVASAEKINPLTEELLVNQFHDILPGTCIPAAHDDAIWDVAKVIAEAEKGTAEILSGLSDGAEGITLVNTLSFDREDVVYLPFAGSYVEGDYVQQVVTDMEGNEKLAVMGAEIPALGTLTLYPAGTADERKSAFYAEGLYLETPFLSVRFDEKGYIESLKDKRNGRQLKGEGYALNTFLVAEDVPLGWDNWDVDADFECKFADRAELLSREVAADGAVEYRIRSSYRLTEKSTLTQDMVFYADSPEIVFETKMDWQDDHRFLKAAFDTNIHTDYASQEIQFGYIRRATNRNTSVEKARFEVSNHKYTDLSETRYGAAVLNDSKYGISVEGSSMRLSLHKGGCMPDYRGDKGVHCCTYALLPHMGSMDAVNVVRPAYLLNEKPLLVKGNLALESLARVEAENVIIETVKPAEDARKAFVLRLYEAEGTQTVTKLSFGVPVEQVEETNMLEETLIVLGTGPEVELAFKPFEIKTLMVNYS